MRVKMLLPLLVHAAVVARGADVYWENHVEPNDFTIPRGDTLVLRGNNTVHGLLLVAAGGTLMVDPDADSFLSVATIDVYGAFRIGSSETPYTRKAVFELACASPFLGPDVRRKAVVVRENATLALFGAKGADPSSLSWTRLQDTAQAGDATLTLEVPRGWEVGDTIAIPSTDFDPHQAETRTIRAVTSTGVQLDRPLQFMHYGRVSEGVDERAEIGLLSRSIVFRGCQERDPEVATPDVGGHMIFLQGFHQVQIQGVQVVNFGQGDQLGRYAMHFHLCGRVPSDTFLSANAIHDSHFRAIVLHGTQGVRVDRNVAFNITGHAVMLEDGAETGNTLRHNLVILVREKLTRVRLGSDAEVALSAFYITNPNNTITDNVVAGVEGTAFWIDTRLEVKGLSYLTGQYEGLHPFKAPLGEIARNVAHSVEVGFKIESPDLDALDAPQQTYSPPSTYRPEQMPVLRDFVVHHSRQGGWFRSYRLALDQWIVGDVTEGLQILSRGDTSTEAVETYVTNSVFVGVTANRGNLVQSRWQAVNYLENRSDSAVDRASDARMAIKLYDGPMFIANCTFRLWRSQPCLNVTNPAIGTRLFNSFLMATQMVASDLTFDQTDVKFFVSDREGDGGISTSMVDTLGAISGFAGATLLPDWGYYATPNCRKSPAWGLACPQRYVNLDVVNVATSTDPTRYGRLAIHRNNVEGRESPQPSLSFSGQYIPASEGWLYHPIISPKASYTLQFERDTPARLRLRFSYTKTGDVFTLVVAYPPGSHVTSVVNQDGTNLSNVTTSSLTSCVNCFSFDATRSFLSITVQERAGPDGRNASCSLRGCLSVEITSRFLPVDTGVTTAQLATILPLVAVTDNTSDWRRQGFALESAAAVDQVGNPDWCRVDDPCLHAIDEGNAKMGVLAFSQSPCVGVGCFSSACRYCKLAISSAKVPFPACPFDPDFVKAVDPPCAEFASIGNSAAGVEVVEDASCVNGGGVHGAGCITDTCRYCKTRETTQSANFLSCSLFSTGLANSSTTSATVSPSTPPPADSSACQRLVSQGDIDAGINAMADATCQFGGLGCFSAECRFCKTRDTRQSSPFLACTDSPTSIVRPIIPSAMAPTPVGPIVAPIDTCWQAVSPGDAAAGLTAVSDTTCSRGGLGCLSPSCRFCSVRLTPQSTPYLPCTAISPPISSSTSTVAVVLPLDPCTGLVSSGDVAAGITAVTQRSCGTIGGLGCVTDACRYCKTRTTPQSAHLLNCTQLTPTTTSTGRHLLQETPPSERALEAVTTIDVCSHAVSIDENVLGIFGVTDPLCTSTTATTDKPTGCFSESCRYCRTNDAVELVLDGDSVAGWALCPPYVVASSIGDSAALVATPSISSLECTARVSFGDAQAGISAVADATCARNSSADSSAGCFARAACRFCKYRDSPRTTSLASCPSFGDTSISTPTPPSCSQLPAMLALPSNVSAADEPRCNAEGRTLNGCIAFSSCRLCATNGSSRLPQCDAITFTARLTSDKETKAQPTDGNSWSTVIVVVVGVACAIAAATIAVHKRVRGPPYGQRVRVATPRSLPRSSHNQRVDIATLSHSSSDATADFFVL